MATPSSTNGIPVRVNSDGTVAVAAERAATEMTSEPIFPELGDSGTARRGGIITGYERNPRLKGVRRWADLADEMLATDAKLAQAEDTLRRTLLSAQWTFQAGAAANALSDDDATPEEIRRGEKALELADRFNRQWGFDGGASWFDIPWEMQLSKMLRFVATGFRYAEEVYAIKDGQVYLKRYADREPASHRLWVWTDDGENLAGVNQTPPTPFPPMENLEFFIPASKLLLLTFNQTGQNVEGRGALRPCWQWYSLKQHFMDLLGVGGERFAVPTPVVLVNRTLAEEAGYSPKQIDDAVSKAQTAAKLYVSGAQTFLSSITGVTFETFGSGEFTPDKMLSVINMADQEMLSAWGLAFLAFGTADVGSHNVGQLLQEQATLAAVNILDTVAGAVNGVARSGGGTIARLIAWNDGDVELDELPVLAHRGIEVSALGQLLAHIPNLINTGALTPSDSLEQALLVLAGLELPADVTRTTEERLAGRNLSPAPTSNITPDGAPEAPMAPEDNEGDDGNEAVGDDG